MPNLWQESDGKWSWSRIVLTVLVPFFIWAAIRVYNDWLLAFHMELQKEQPDLDGVTGLFEAMMIGFVGGVLIFAIIKIGNKIFENRERHHAIHRKRPFRPHADDGSGEGIEE